MTENQKLYACSCAEVYGDHVPECPTLQQFERLTKAYIDLAAEKAFDFVPVDREVQRLRATLEKYQRLTAMVSDPCQWVQNEWTTRLAAELQACRLWRSHE
jgi:hypothetical protein